MAVVGNGAFEIANPGVVIGWGKSVDVLERIGDVEFRSASSGVGAATPKSSAGEEKTSLSGFYDGDNWMNFRSNRLVVRLGKEGRSKDVGQGGDKNEEDWEENEKTFALNHESIIL